MSESKRGPVWGGAAEEWMLKKEERKQEITTAIKDIPILFDTDNFQDLIGHLNLLEAGEIGDLQVGEKKYSISIIKELIKVTIGDFSKEERRKKVNDGTITDGKIIQYLKDRGITGGKINDESMQGFRECMLKCIKNMCKQTT